MTGLKLIIVGPSASGKTTVAATLHRKKPSIQWVEASRDLIERREYPRTGSFLADRERGFEYFTHASRRDGPQWAANRVLKSFSRAEDVIVTGIRGIENVELLQRSGFYCVYLTADAATSVRRLSMREGIEPAIAAEYLRREGEFYDHNRMLEISNFVVDTTELDESDVERIVVNIAVSVTPKQQVSIVSECCPSCVNPRLNHEIFKRGGVVCDVCDEFERSSWAGHDENLLQDIFRRIKLEGDNTAALGFSGGKDSYAAALYLREKVGNLRLFTVDTGYYPITMLRRSDHLAKSLELPHDFVDAKKQMTDEIKASYALTSDFFKRIADDPDLVSSHEFYQIYRESRVNYSTKVTSPAVFPRVCVLCRKLVIRSYYAYARSNNIKYVFLGINEWTRLSKTAGLVTRDAEISGVRRLDPLGDGNEVYIIHLPFLTDASLFKNTDILRKGNWQLPFGEQLVETNANSCLFAKCSEGAFFDKTGFHPDSTRLAREVTVGFLRRSEAMDALSRVSRVQWSPSDIIEYSGLLNC